MKWRLLIAAIVLVTMFTSGLMVISIGAALMNEVSVLAGLLVLIVGIFVTAGISAWVFEKLIFWRTQ